MKDEAAGIRAGPSNPLLRYQANEDDDPDEPQHFCDLDYNDENLSFS